MTEIENSMYAVQMVLTIKQLQKSDFGGYKCISKNSIGGIEATIRLYGKLPFQSSEKFNWKNALKAKPERISAKLFCWHECGHIFGLLE